MDTTATVMLVRHGKVANPNHVVYADLPGFDLGPDGVLQAHAVGRHLADHPVGAVISSPLVRAVHTASSIAQRHGLDVITDERLSEWDLSRRWVGQIWEELPSIVPGELEAYLENPADLSYAHETLSMLSTRVVAAIEHGLESLSRNIVVVAHQDPVAVAALVLTGGQLEDLLDDPPTHASVTTVERDPSGAWRRTHRWDPSER
jgi:broad specificity phosphatase PhoE